MELLHDSSIVISLQDGNASLRQEIQNAAREIRDQIRQEVRQTRQGATQTPATAQAPTPPPGPGPPGGLVITTPDGGRQIVVGGSEIPFNPNEVIPPQAVDISLAFFFTVAAIIIGLPISRAFARRMDRKAGPSQITPEVSHQLRQLTQAVDAIALEVERISEGQRFTTRLLSEQRDSARQALPAGPDR